MTEKLLCAHCSLPVRLTVEPEKTAHYIHAISGAISCGASDRTLKATVGNDEQDGLFDAPVAHARKTDPITSHLAAKALTGQKISQLKQWVLEALRKYGPMTHEEMYDAYILTSRAAGMPVHKEQSVRSRCNELVKEHGLVIDSGIKRKMRDGNLAIVWTLAD